MAWEDKQDYYNLRKEVEDLREENIKFKKENKDLETEIRITSNATRRETKAIKIVIALIIVVLIGLTVNINNDIEGIKDKIIREHGYGY